MTKTQECERRLPVGIRRITVNEHNRNNGGSWGLEYPLIFGFLNGIGYAIWDRHTGDVVYVSPIFGAILGQKDVSDRSAPIGYANHATTEDSEP